MDIGQAIISIIGALAVIAAGWKLKQDNEKTKLADKRRQDDAALADKKRQDDAEAIKLKIEADAATVKFEIETAAAKLKLETEAATALALAETEKARERERAADALELEKFRAEMAKELEDYRTKRAQFETTAAALNAQIVKELAAMTTGVGATRKAVGTSEKRLSEQITMSSDKVLGGVEKLRELFMLAFDLFLENPPALPERVDRMMLAFKAGDVVEAQAVADEAPPQVSEEAA